MSIKKNFIILSLLFLCSGFVSLASAAEIKTENSVPNLYVDGKPIPVIDLREHAPWSPKKLAYLKKANSQGVKIVWLAWRVPFFPEDEKSLQNNMAMLDKRIGQIRSEMPDSLIMLQLLTTIKTKVHDGWIKKNPGQLEVWPPFTDEYKLFNSVGALQKLLNMKQANMVTGDRVSSVSKLFWQSRLKSLEYMGKHLAACDYADKIVGAVICGGNGEWMSYWDFSQPALHDYRIWLGEKYKDDEHLQAAWNNDSAKIANAQFPQWSDLVAEGDVGIFYDPRKSRPVIDFLEYHHTRFKDVVSSMAGAFKKSSQGKIPVGVWGGGISAGSPSSQIWYGRGKSRNPSSLLFSDKNIDFFINPYGYRERHSGGLFMHQVGSAELNGKMLLAEEDTRTPLTPAYKKYASWEKLGDNFGQAKTLKDAKGVLKRNFAGAFTNPGSGISYFSLGGGLWFDHPEIIKLFGQFEKIAEQVITRPEKSCEIAIITNRGSIPFLAMSNFSPYYEQMLEFCRIGAPVKYYRIDDLEHPDFPFERYKLYIFPDSYYVSPKDRMIIEKKIKTGGKTVVWMYAPGYVTDKCLSVAAASKLIGMRLDSSGNKLKLEHGLDVMILGNKTPWTNKLDPTMRYCVKQNVSPAFWVDDPEAIVIGEALASDRQICTYRKPGLCVKKYPEWTSIWSAIPNMPAGLLRNIAVAAGVHIYTDCGDQIFVGRGLYSQHAAYDGKRQIKFPKKVKVKELFDEVKLPKEAVDSLTIDMYKGQTIILEISSE